MTTQTYFQMVPDTFPRQYSEVAELPSQKTAPNGFRGYTFVSSPAFVVHSKLHNSFVKPQPFVVRGMTRDRLLTQKLTDHVDPSANVHTKTLYAVGTWHEIDMDYTVEGYRFVRLVRKVIAFLQFLVKENVKAEKKALKAKKDFDDRGQRCGLCPVCFGDYVAKDSQMVHHGYQRPGVGYIVGDCHGVSFPPFEVSCEGTKSWLKVLEQTLAIRQAALTDLATRTSIMVLRDMKRIDGRSVPDNVLLTNGDVGFQSAIENKRMELQRDVDNLNRDIKMYTQKITEWTAQPFPRKG